MSTDSSSPQPLTLAGMFAGRPIVPAAALFMLGIGLSGHIGASTAMALWLSVSLFLLSLVFRSRAGISAVCLAVALGTLGQLAGWRESCRFPADHIGRFTADAPRVVRLEARIVDPPRLLTSPMNQRPLPPRQSTQAEVLRVFTKDGWRIASGRVVVHLREPHPRLAVAQTVRLSGLLSRPGGVENPGEFDWSDYYRQQRILASVSVPHIENIEILRADPPSLPDRLRIGARECLEVGFTPERSTDHALLRALVLGDTDPQLRDIQAQFIRTGTSHHLAISGMHIAIIGGLALWCLRLAGLRPRTACITAMGIVSLYGAVVLPNPPVVRSLLLCLAIGLGMLSRRGIDAVQLLAASVLAMLVLNPLDLHNAGFQLSFGSVLGLMLFSRPVMRWIASFGDRDLALAANLQPWSFWRSAWSWLRHNLLEAAVASTVAWLVSAPLIAWHFNQLNPWAILASVVLAIPVLFALVGGVLKILLTLLLPGLSGLLAQLADWPVWLMRYSLDMLDRLPGSNHVLPTPSPALLLLYYLLLALPLLLRGRPRWPGRLRFTPLLCPLILFAPALWHGAPMQRPPGECRITFLSVGAGQCAIAQLPSGRALLFDAGSQSDGDPYRRTVQPALQQLGVTSIDRIFLSHANFDHFSAITDLVRQVPVGQINVGPTFRQDASHNHAASLLQAEIELAGVPMNTLARPAKLVIEPGVSVEVLWPTSAPPGHDNDASLVLKLNVRGRTILFCGDIQAKAEEALLARPEELQANILIAPHHGSAEQPSAAFVKAVAPKMVLACSAARLSGKQVTFDQSLGSTPLIRTGHHGAITLGVQPDGRISVDTWNTGLHWDWP